MAVPTMEESALCSQLIERVKDYFQSAEHKNGISKSQLYKMAGNSIVVTVLENLFKQIYNWCFLSRLRMFSRSAMSCTSFR